MRPSINLPLFLCVSESKTSILRVGLEISNKNLVIRCVGVQNFCIPHKLPIDSLVFCRSPVYETYQIISYNENDVWLGALLDGAC